MPAPRRWPGRAALSLPARTPSTSARTCRPAAAGRRSGVCRNRERRPPRGQAASLPPGPASRPILALARDSRARRCARQRSGDRLDQVVGQIHKRRVGRRFPHVDDEVSARPRERAAVSPEDLAQPTTHAIARRGDAHTLGHRKPQLERVGPRQKKHLEVASGHPDPGGVTLFEIPSFAKAVVPGEGLPDNPARVHTASFLRPLRRRAERTARPERVRIRTRKPWVRLRRRLFG